MNKNGRRAYFDTGGGVGADGKGREATGNGREAGNGMKANGG